VNCSIVRNWVIFNETVLMIFSGTGYSAVRACVFGADFPIGPAKG
jgi:hypothetical protein